LCRMAAKGQVGRGSPADEIRRQLVHLVAVAHPDGRLLRQAANQRIVGRNGQSRAAELARLRRLDLSAEDVRAQLHPVADAEDRARRVEDLGIAARRPRLVHAAGPTGKDQALGIELAEFVDGNVRPDKLAEDTLFADPPRDELGVLRAEVEDRDAFVVDHRDLIGNARRM